MGSANTADVNAYAPLGRNFEGLVEYLPDNDDDWKRIYRNCEDATDDSYPFCGNED